MTSNFDSGGLQFAWDATSMTWAQECLYKYYLTQIEGWREKHNSPNLLFGGWYATALEHFHKFLATGMDRDEALRLIVREALESTWIDGKPWDSSHNSKTRNNLIRTIVWYCDQFNPDPLKVVTLSDGRPAVEYSFALEIDNGWLWCGHIDRLVEYSGDVYVQDQKTTASTLASYYFEQFDPDIQMSGYAFAGKSIYKSPVKGVIIDAAQVAVGFSRFERGFTFRTEAKLEEWYHDTLYWIGVTRQATAEQKFPMNRTSCNKFGGCVFRKVCSKSPEVREQFLKADFDKKELWNPLRAR